MILKWIALGASVIGGMGTAHAEEGDFFPLEVGNRWIYQKYDWRYPDHLRVEETASMEVIGQVSVAGAVVFRLATGLELAST